MKKNFTAISGTGFGTSHYRAQPAGLIQLKEPVPFSLNDINKAFPASELKSTSPKEDVIFDATQERALVFSDGPDGIQQISSPFSRETLACFIEDARHTNPELFTYLRNTFRLFKPTRAALDKYRSKVIFLGRDARETSKDTNALLEKMISQKHTDAGESIEGKTAVTLIQGEAGIVDADNGIDYIGSNEVDPCIMTFIYRPAQMDPTGERLLPPRVAMAHFDDITFEHDLQDLMDRMPSSVPLEITLLSYDADFDSKARFANFFMNRNVKVKALLNEGPEHAVINVRTGAVSYANPPSIPVGGRRDDKLAYRMEEASNGSRNRPPKAMHFSLQIDRRLPENDPAPRIRPQLPQADL